MAQVILLLLAPSARRHTQRRVRHNTESSLRYLRSFAPLFSSSYNSYTPPISPQLCFAPLGPKPCPYNLHISPKKPPAPLRWATLRSATPGYATLRSASQRFAERARGACFAPLRYAKLHSQLIFSAPLRSASLCSASLRYAPLRFATLRSDTIRYATIRSATLRSATLCSAPIPPRNPPPIHDKSPFRHSPFP